jgi:hypothetical protein
MGGARLDCGQDRLHGGDAAQLGSRRRSGTRAFGPAQPRTNASGSALERESLELRWVNEILRKASVYFTQAELDRRFKPRIALVDDHRGVCGVGPICKLLPTAPLTCHTHATRRAHPARPRRVLGTTL